ncbi:MAG: 30S ribosomal protein S9 [Planctomycetota bacterium]|nr:30S ribosomal protein S9 [Planctomycetota bacterium]
MTEEAPVNDNVETPAEPVTTEAPVSGSPKTYIWGTGRRKKAIARVRIRSGSGKVLINKRPVDEYFKSDRDRRAAVSPLNTVQMTSSYDVWANVNGGGPTGQADAVMLGLARALTKAAPETTESLREKGLLTRDARMKERKKYGQKGARKRFQFSKR